MNILAVVALTLMTCPLIGWAGSCSLIPDSKSCVDTTPCKTDTQGNQVCLAGSDLPAGAIAIPQTCWQYSYAYACSGQSGLNSCTPYETDKGCSLVSSTCLDKVPETGQCSTWQYTYQCLVEPEQTEPRVVCSGGLFNPEDFAAPTNRNSNFAKAAILQEIMREAQVYTQNGIFSGVSESCTKGYFGIKNCCTPSPGGKSNSAMMNMAFGAAANVVKYAGGQAISVASEYMYDMLYDNGFVTQGMMSDLLTNDRFGTNFASNPLSASAWGFTLGFGAPPTGAADFIMAGGGQWDAAYISYNPYSLAAQVAIMYIQSLASCDQSEQLLALHRGQSLSVFVGEQCVKKVLGSCIEWRNNYCSFNSVLAKIINTDGKKQLGQNLSNCSGISTDDLARIDFTRVDFSEFTSAVVNQATRNLPANINGNYTPLMQNASSGSSQGNNPVLPSY